MNDVDLVDALETITKDCFGEGSNKVITCAPNLAHNLRLLAKYGRCRIVEEDKDGWIVAEWVTK